MGFADRIAVQLRKPSGGLFGRLAEIIMSRGNAQANQWTISLIDIQPTDRIFEVGFGPGLAIERASQIAQAGFVAGIDFSESMVQRAQKRNASAIRAGRVDLKHGDVSASLSYNDNFFDKIFSVHGIYFWPDPVRSLQELHRVLKPSGLIAIMVYSKDEFSKKKVAQTGLFSLYTGEGIVDMLTEVRFSKAWFETKPFKYAPGICALAIK